MSDAKYFQTTKRGEIHELKEELHTNDKSKQKEAVKKVIAAMTVGKDVSMLFPDVCNCMQTPNVELKKLVYLYLINYAKAQPDLAILAVNTFVKDASDSNPLIRALAVRTMGCIRVEQITEYLTNPLLKTLKDEDPYVRKTAAMCVAKLYDINPDLVKEQGFLDLLIGLISDPNPTVVANAVASLTEIAEASGMSDIFTFAPEALMKLLSALNECTEWGQVYILDAISTYRPSDAKEAESIIERVIPRLQHANAAVVLSAVKVVLGCLQLCTNAESVKTYIKKLSPPLVTLLASEPEIQYVALRNIQLICSRRPNILANDIKVFFCKYNDPTYVKVEKVDVMVMLANERTVEQVLLELKEYAFAEVDVDFVRKAVRAIGKCALKIERCAERCVAILLDLIQTKVSYVVQESIVVIKDIFRKYPNQYESVIGTLCENLESLEHPEAKGALIWIIGQYAERIENAKELLEAFIEEFADLDVDVQLQLLTATVKLFLKRPSNTQGTVKEILQLATTKSNNPDLRDRGYIYWRLLSTDPEKAKIIVLAEHSTVQYDPQKVDNQLLDLLLHQISSLASVYHKPTSSFLVNTGRQAQPTQQSTNTSGAVMDVMDLLGGDLSSSAPSQPKAQQPVVNDLLDLMSDLSFQPTSTPSVDMVGSHSLPAKMNSLLTADKGGGMAVDGILVRSGGKISYELQFKNISAAGPLSGFAIQFNKNFFGLTNAVALQVPTLTVGQSQTVSLAMTCKEDKTSPATPSLGLQVAIKNATGIYYFKDTIPLEVILSENGRINGPEYPQLWQSIPAANQVHTSLMNPRSLFVDIGLGGLGLEWFSFGQFFHRGFSHPPVPPFTTFAFFRKPVSSFLYLILNPGTTE
ncbi:Adaptor protein complex 1/2 subunit beta 1 [Guillardia theta CCMP2712]|uniref:Adaptor protein complex 1/2 subunit beta 1 n=1 Tax=Guillardia theta (strain CCMP2712) TaxID=905079 RepID=L1IYK8_GUITC|nr:Adaptor protein complex 1/2 subunit beta 1 [Guillardia theta CCMP2712]EKX40910.1 Adaptor protein complex 1/2 subunit beta 1 [Guillardia theta CCMP2712]|eukprot:XP_005827890.1 Adaptor protein complex 1/2 subunit beta 1 [Guillardia theta CCMP2712]